MSTDENNSKTLRATNYVFEKREDIRFQIKMNTFEPPLPQVNIDTYFSLRAKLCLRGGGKWLKSVRAAGSFSRPKKLRSHTIQYLESGIHRVESRIDYPRWREYCLKWAVKFCIYSEKAKWFLIRGRIQDWRHLSVTPISQLRSTAEV